MVCRSLIFSALIGAAPLTAFGQDQAYQGLPGVKIYKNDELSAKNACSSEIRARFDRRTGQDAPVRVYICRQGNAYFESTEPPDEDAWRRLHRAQ